MPVRYKKYKYYETLNLGNVVPRNRIKRRTTVLPKEIKYIGENGTLAFKVLDRFDHEIKAVDLRVLSYIKNHRGLEISAVRSLKTGAAEELLKKAEVIAKYRKAKYIYFFSVVPKMINLGLKLGYRYLGEDKFGFVYLIKRIK